MDEKCGECTAAIKATETVIVCSGVCKVIFHIKCLNIANREYQTMNNVKNARWFCDKCLSYLQMSLELVAQFNEFRAAINSQFEDFRKSLMPASDMSRQKVKNYSDVVKDVVIIKPKSKQNNLATKEDICKSVNPASLEVGMVEIKNIKDGGVVIRCQNKEDSGKIKDAAEKKLKKKYSIKVPQLINPCIKIIGIEEEIEENDLKSCILKQNSFIQHEKSYISVKVLKKMKTKYMCIIEVDPLTYNRIMKEGRLSIGWNICKVFEYVNVHRCFRCAGFDHIAKDCSREIGCLKCGVVGHSADDCKNEKWCCQNCVNANKTLELNLVTEHSPYSDTCPCLLRKIDVQRRKINFDTGEK